MPAILKNDELRFSNTMGEFIASTLMALPPIFLIPIDYLVFKEKVSARAILGTIIALAGVAILFLI